MTIVERVIVLQQVRLFADVPGRVLAAVARRATEQQVDAGAPVIVKGALEDHLFVIVSGRLRVHDGERVLTTLGPGVTVGELAAVPFT